MAIYVSGTGVQNGRQVRIEDKLESGTARPYDLGRLGGQDRTLVGFGARGTSIIDYAAPSGIAVSKDGKPSNIIRGTYLGERVLLLNAENGCNLVASTTRPDRR